MVSLVDTAGDLRITVQDLQDPGCRRYEFVFRGVPAYRNILEEYRVSEPPLRAGVGWTITIPDSPWLDELRAKEPLLDVHSPGCRHFAIVTEDDVVDVLTAEEPEICEVAPADTNEPLPGKSQILRYLEDRERIDRLADDIRERNRDV